MEAIDNLIQLEGYVILDKQNDLSSLIVSFCNYNYKVSQDKVRVEFLGNGIEDTIIVRYQDKVFTYDTIDHKLINSFDRKKAQYVERPRNSLYTVCYYETDAYIISK